MVTHISTQYIFLMQSPEGLDVLWRRHCQLLVIKGLDSQNVVWQQHDSDLDRSGREELVEEVLMQPPVPKAGSAE